MYTVGWICALPVELAAAQAMLDEEHVEVPRDIFDPNLYTLGRIGNLNIVITCLPAGHIGIGPAAAGAARMMSKFKSIRFGLMVGIGGGVPSPTADIRLGDVVVSHPFKQHGGVVQYDLGKTGGEGRMTRTGFLNSPPSVLLNAVSQLRADRYRERDTFGTYLEVFEKLPQFRRDNAGPDMLFDANHAHRGGPRCEDCEIEKIICRNKRQRNEKVAIHYGTIASGNQVIRDGLTRDRLSEELGGVLCFEMEAAGLMNSFPCLVVRGICDYADSHKNKTWQPYAAATAAVCAKAILSFVPSSMIADAAETRAIYKYDIPFSLKGVPLGKFAERPKDVNALDQMLMWKKPIKERRVVILHGLGGVGKTQLAVDFARRHQHDFSSIFWLNGSSRARLKDSLARCAERLPEDQVSAAARMFAMGQGGNTDIVAKDVLAWLSLKNNGRWLIIVDNVDTDSQRRIEDTGYEIEDFLPPADHGSVLITTRYPHLKQLGEHWEVKRVEADCARAIVGMWYGKNIGELYTRFRIHVLTINVIEEDIGELLKLLDGLPLALAQAASYVSETSTKFDSYVRLYKNHWRELWERCDERHMPLRCYVNGSVATTWEVSFISVKARNKYAANLLLLWSHLDHNSLWYELLATAAQESPTVAMLTSTLLGKIAQSEIQFANAMDVLRDYSLVEQMENQVGYATHPVLHQWARHMQDDMERKAFSQLALLTVGFAVPMGDQNCDSILRSKLLPHAELCMKDLEGFVRVLLEEREFEEILTMLRALYSVGSLFASVGYVEKAEKVHSIVLEAYEIAFSQSQ